jgi:RNA polymerase primary sigma factor
MKIAKQITQRTEDSINRYFQEINKFPMISAEEEVELAIRIRNGDEEALEKLVVANLRFVVSVAKQYQNQGLSLSDLINEGNHGLVKAAKRYDETRGFKFISYAVWWIRQSIIQAISDQTRIVRLPLNRVSAIKKITRAIPLLEQTLERDPTDEEIAGYLEISCAEVKIANDIKKGQVSFDMPFSQNGESDYSLYDVVQTGDIPSPDNKTNIESMVININRALSKLNPREAQIIIMSFGLFGTPVLRLHDIAEKYDMSSERIRQIRGKGLSKLKILLKGKYAFF